MVLPEITAYIAADGLSLTSGTNLFYGDMPELPDFCVTFHEYSGLPNEPNMGTLITRAEFPRIQVTVRGLADDYDTPRLKAQQIVTSLAKIVDQQLSGVMYHAVIAQQPVFKLRKDGNFRYIFACNFQVDKDYSTS